MSTHKGGDRPQTGRRVTEFTVEPPRALPPKPAPKPAPPARTAQAGRGAAAAALAAGASTLGYAFLVVALDASPLLAGTAAGLAIGTAAQWGSGGPTRAPLVAVAGLFGMVCMVLADPLVVYLANDIPIAWLLRLYVMHGDGYNWPDFHLVALATAVVAAATYLALSKQASA